MVNWRLILYQPATDQSKIEKHDAGCRHSNGTLQDLLDCQRDGSKIINALDFPMPCSPHPPTSLASDVLAFLTTIDMPLCGRSILFPASGTRWGIAASSGAHHLWHTDCNGLCTYIDTQTGCKWWVLARPRVPSDFSDTSLFTAGFAVDRDNGDIWVLEAIPLTPGSRL